jgi:predicted DsbA family dithiol-disulfide isomerase
MATALFRAYFSRGRNVSSHDVLVDCATEAGIEAERARALLAGDQYAEEVRASQQTAQRRGITGVPCYVFGERHAVMGAQPVDALTEALDVAAPEAPTGE